jgi:hypothetical protein
VFIGRHAQLRIRGKTDPVYQGLVIAPHQRRLHGLVEA